MIDGILLTNTVMGAMAKHHEVGGIGDILLALRTATRTSMVTIHNFVADLTDIRHHVNDTMPT